MILSLIFSRLTNSKFWSLYSSFRSKTSSFVAVKIKELSFDLFDCSSASNIIFSVIGKISSSVLIFIFCNLIRFFETFIF